MEQPVLLIRPEDLIWLKLSVENLVLDTSHETPVLRRTDEAQDALLVLELPAQAIAEEAFYFTKLDPPNVKWDRARTILSSPTRLVFRVPPEISGIHYSPEGILGILPRCTVVVARNARSDLPPQEVIKPTKPGSQETAIEAPYRLVLSPDQCAAWEHAATPVTHEGRTELWHTRLGFRRPQEGDEDPACVPGPTANIRVLWSQDCPEGEFQAGPPAGGCPPPVNEPAEQTPRPGDQKPMLNSLWPKVRCRLAWLTTSRRVLFTEQGQDYAAPLAGRQIILSSLGAWLNLYGEWIFPSPVARMEHRATMGREQVTRVELRGYFCPLGHRATIILVTERRLRPDLDGTAPIAYLVQEMYIETAEPIKHYATAAYEHEGREFPYQSIRILTQRTPRIPIDDVPKTMAFWIQIGGSDFMFAVEGVDKAGKTIRWQMPLAFVCQEATSTDLKHVLDDFTDARRRRPLDGQRLTYVDESQAGGGQPSGKTSLNTQNFTFGIATPKAPDPAGPSFLPVMDSAEVLIPAIQHLTRDGLGAQTIQYFKGFLEEGLTPKLGEVFASIVKTPNNDLPGLDLPPELGGGLANLRPTFAGLSRELGPIGQLPELVPGTNAIKAPDALEMLGNSELLGGIRLRDIVELPKDWKELGSKAPRVPGLTVTYDDPRDPKLITATLKFEPIVRNQDLGVLEFVASVPGGGPDDIATLKLSAETQIRRDGSPPTTVVRGDLTQFVIRIKEVVEVSFKRFGFSSRGGEKPDVNVELHKVKFLGALEFVQKFTQYIEPGGFSDPPSLDVTSDGLMLAYSATLPPIPLGVFTLENISLGASLFLPLFGNRPFAVGFQFARRERKFHVGIAPFAGGGFFGIVVSAKDGVQEIEAGIEFGGSLSLNLGVASGGVSVMAGIDFKLEKKTTGTTAALTGYFRANGSLEVLGIVRISVEIYIGLTVQFKPSPDKPIIIHGEARLVLQVSVLFFSVSVSLSVERSFNGPDPGFAENMPLPAWKRYALAFA